MEKLIAVDSVFLGPERTRAFTAKMGQMIKPPKGRIVHARTFSQMDQAFALRVLLGIPENNLPPNVRTITAAAGDLILGGPPPPQFWTNVPNWRPLNPRAAKGLIAHAKIDLDFMRSFGLADVTWARILGAKRPASASALERAFAELAAFGFPDPRQFFMD